MKIELLVRDYGRMIGLSRYTKSLVQALTSTGLEFELISPEYPWAVNLAHALLSPIKYDVKTFFTTYPVKARLSRSALKHLTTQQMASLLWLNPQMHPTVISVADIIPYIVKGNPEQDVYRHQFDRFFDNKSMRSLHKADAIITISNYTKNTLIKQLNCLEERITTVYLGVDRSKYLQMPVPDSFLEHYSLDLTGQFFLSVGSDNPRKNLPRLIQAFATVHDRHPQARLVKVGTSESQLHNDMHRHMITDLGLAQVVHWLGQVPETDLPLFYNLARGFIFPSLYEGFGLPVLEAMACGTPVVTSSAASLPEVAGDAALYVDPLDVGEIAFAMCRILEDPSLALELEQKGLQRARQFTWENTANQTIAVYEKVTGEKLL